MRLPALGRKTRDGLLLGLLLGLLGTLLTETQALKRIDLVLYDSLIAQQFRPPSEEIAIVAIDEASLSELGRWPWSRATHARLLDELTRLDASAVAFDILFPEADAPQSDAELAAAIQRNGRTVLAIAPAQGIDGRLVAAALPRSELALAAAAMGHVDIELDRDGLVRSVYLYAGLGDARWPALGLALKQIAHPEASTRLASRRNPSSPRPDLSRGWVRDQRVLIPFAGPNGHFPRLSYVDVLQQRVDPARLRDRIVLVGATAAGLGDALATPAANERERMPGVELNANVLQILLENRAIAELPGAQQLLINLLLAMLSALLLLRVPLRLGLATTLGLVGSTLGGTLLALLVFQVWFAPVTLLTLQLLAYPVASWLGQIKHGHALARLHHRVEHQARHHAITELPNQLGLQEYLQGRLLSSSPPPRLALLILHLGPEEISNHSLGFTGSSQVLKEIATRLAENTRRDDLVAHLSGNDFALVIDGTEQVEVIHKVGALLNRVIAPPIALDEHELHLSLAIGASRHPGDADDTESLLRHAYIAMHKAKHERSPLPCIYDPAFEQEDHSRMRFERLLRRALGNSELEVYYQPQVYADSGRLVGVEALLRWKSPELGLVGPVRFIPVAEQTGLIIEIGSWVIQQACAQARRWMDQGLGEIRMAVNLSANQFAQPNLVELVTRTLQETGLKPSQLELEITEGALIRNMDAARAALRALRRMGVKIAIDDFGTGYSSLSYLKYFPLDRIKIDRSFVTEIGQAEQSSELALAIIDMAHKLKLEVIAEGVENETQAEFLRANHCDEFQGYLYGKPLTATELAQQLSDGRLRN